VKEAYAERLPILRATARQHGYALGLHGSGERDLDLIAVPWIDEPSSPEILVEALRGSIDGFMVRHEPHPKPHGRLTWAIHLHDPCGRLYVDLSVMPVLKTENRE
jgi:hypothetical protein